METVEGEIGVFKDQGSDLFARQSGEREPAILSGLCGENKSGTNQREKWVRESGCVGGGVPNHRHSYHHIRNRRAALVRRLPTKYSVRRESEVQRFFIIDRR